MSASGNQVRHLLDHGDTAFYLEALRFQHYNVTIHSPRVSPDPGKYAVTAYGVIGKRPEMLQASCEHLHDAIKAVAFEMGAHRLKAYARVEIARQMAVAS